MTDFNAARRIESRDRLIAALEAERDALVKALEPFAKGIITPDGTIIGLMREDVARARAILAAVGDAPK